VIPPPPKKSGPPVAPPVQQVPLTPQEFYAKKQADVQIKWQRMMEMHRKFVSKFVKGDKWEIMTGFPLWANENSEERVAYMNPTTMTNNRTVIEIVIVGRTRLRVRATRWNPLVQQLTGIDPTGWMDVGMAVDLETEKLLMRPYDPHGMYVQTATGQEPVLRTRIPVEETLRMDPEIGAGLHLSPTPAGMQVDDIDPAPGQPGLAVGDLIVGIGGVNLVGLPGKMAVEAAFRAAFVDGASLEVAV